jgi:hypothetical protein
LFSSLDVSASTRAEETRRTTAKRRPKKIKILEFIFLGERTFLISLKTKIEKDVNRKALHAWSLI